MPRTASLSILLAVLLIQLAAGFALLTFLGVIIAVIGRLGSLSLQIARIETKIKNAEEKEKALLASIPQTGSDNKSK